MLSEYCTSPPLMFTVSPFTFDLISALLILQFIYFWNTESKEREKFTALTGPISCGHMRCKTLSFFALLSIQRLPLCVHQHVSGAHYRFNKSKSELAHICIALLYRQGTAVICVMQMKPRTHALDFTRFRLIHIFVITMSLWEYSEKIKEISLF